MEKNNQTNKYLILGGVTILVLLGWNYYNGKPTTLNLQETSNPTSTAEAVNWKTYTNTQFGFSFNYPQNFSSDVTIPNGVGVSFAPITYRDLDFQNLPMVSLSVFEKETNQQNFIKSLQSPAYSNIQNVKTSILNGYEVTKFSSTNTQAGSGGVAMNTVINLKQGLVMITLANSEKGMIDTYNEILSTFKLSN